MIVARLARRLLVAAPLAAGLVMSGSWSVGGAPPVQWPHSQAALTAVDGWPSAIRLSGNDRYATNLAMALTLRGAGDSPFDSPDRSSAGAPDLGTASSWWGLRRCPRAIIVVAGDLPADALSASALSDPSGRSSEPYLVRTASSNSTFFPVGDLSRVDTDAAPIIVTASGRAGAASLSPAATIAARDLRQGGCKEARRAIIVGGELAVPAGVDHELLQLGYDQIFRVAGRDRYDTAALVARSLGTASGATDCGDEGEPGGLSFGGNAVVQYWEGDSPCRRLSHTVVLADAITGADALAAGWWVSFHQVPVLLHDGGASLPAATKAALISLDVDNLIVLGGADRIPPSAVDEAVGLTGGEAHRIAGSNRYETSVLMAERFGNWQPSVADAANSMVCLAASSGNGAAARGWPDALGAGPWCGLAAASRRGSPARAVNPLDGGAPRLIPSGPAAPRAVPVLLVPYGATTLPPSVAEFLDASYPRDAAWCSSTTGDGQCVDPGFIVAIGGPPSIPDVVVGAASQLVGPRSPENGRPTAPRSSGAWLTSLDLRPVFRGAGDPNAACFPRNGYAEARWLASYTSDGVAATFVDAMFDGLYRHDSDGVQRSPGVGAPACVGVPATATSMVRAVGIDGRESTAVSTICPTGRRLALSGPFVDAVANEASGPPSGQDTSLAGTTVRRFVSSASGLTMIAAGTSRSVAAADLTVHLTRGQDDGAIHQPDTFTAEWSIDTDAGTVVGQATGEAIFAAGSWELRGRTDVTSGVEAGDVTGGFTATWSTAADALSDRATWQLDGC